MSRKGFTIMLLILIVLILSMMIIAEANGQEVPKKEDFKHYETFDEIEKISPEEGGTEKASVPLYQIKNANAMYDAYYNLLEDANKVVKTVNEDIIPEYNKVYTIAEELSEENDALRSERDTYKVLAISGGVVIVVGTIAGTIFFTIQ